MFILPTLISAPRATVLAEGSLRVSVVSFDSARERTLFSDVAIRAEDSDEREKRVRHDGREGHVRDVEHSQTRACAHAHDHTKE